MRNHLQDIDSCYDNLDRNDSDLLCPICLESFRIGDCVAWSLRLMTCNHVFHTDCIQEWLGKSQFDCPCCRGDFRGVNNKSCLPGEMHRVFGMKNNHESASHRHAANISPYIKRKEGQFCIRQGLIIPS